MKLRAGLKVGVVVTCLVLGACASMTSRPIEGLTWTLTELGGAPTGAAQVGREPFLFFDPGPPQRVSGSTGCNRLAGTYALAESRISVGQVATTKMACLDGMEQEQAFLAMLAALEGWRIVDQRLDLLDAQGERLARFTAGPRSQDP